MRSPCLERQIGLPRLLMLERVAGVKCSKCSGKPNVFEKFFAGAFGSKIYKIQLIIYILLFF